MRPISLISLIALILLTSSTLRADNTGTEFTPYKHASSTARLRAALHQEQASAQSKTQSPAPSRFTRQKQRASTSTYFIPPKGFANCSDGSCRRKRR